MNTQAALAAAKTLLDAAKSGDPRLAYRAHILTDDGERRIPAVSRQGRKLSRDEIERRIFEGLKGGPKSTGEIICDCKVPRVTAAANLKRLAREGRIKKLDRVRGQGKTFFWGAV